VDTLLPGLFENHVYFRQTFEYPLCYEEKSTRTMKSQKK